MGNHPLFELVKCEYRCLEYPFQVGGVLRFAGYIGFYLSGRKKLLPPSVVLFIRQEQLARLFLFAWRPAVSMESQLS